jgi:hypothetical protein
MAVLCACFFANKLGSYQHSVGLSSGLDFTPIDDVAPAEETPVIVVKHGLTGGK